MSRPSQQSLGALARVNPQAAMKVQEYFSGLDEDSRKREAAKYKVAAPVLLQAQQMPYEQRRQFIQAAAPALMASGWTQQELAGFDPTDENVKALSSAAMTVSEVVDANKIDWHQSAKTARSQPIKWATPRDLAIRSLPQQQHPGRARPNLPAARSTTCSARSSSRRAAARPVFAASRRLTVSRSARRSYFPRPPRRWRASWAYRGSRNCSGNVTASLAYQERLGPRLLRRRARQIRRQHRKGAEILSRRPR
jgi:hypothetical protein